MLFKAECLTPKTLSNLNLWKKSDELKLFEEAVQNNKRMSHFPVIPRIGPYSC